MSLHRSQLARPAEQHGKNSKRRATPEPITAQVSQWATDQAQHILQLFEAGTHSHEQDAGGGNFSISTAAILKLLTDEFSANDLEDGRYAPQQRMQGSESLPATTGEFNCMLNVAVHFVNLELMKRPAQCMWDAELPENDWVRVCPHSMSV